MDLFLHVAGALIVLVSLHDIFFTVLFPASRRGPIREPLAGPGMLSGSSTSGPVVITVPLAAWFVLLVIGWAMIYKPALGTAVAALSGPTDTGWATAIYFSGFSLTTAGADEYIALRAQWDRPLRDLAEAMLYEWESI